MTYTLSKYSNLKQRVIAAFLGAFLLLGAIFWSEWSYFAVFLVILILSQLEFYKLVGLDGMVPLKFWGTLTGSLIFTISFLVESGMADKKYYIVIFPVAACIFLIKLYKKGERKPFTNIAITFLGVLYVALPFSLLNFLLYLKGIYSYQILMGLLFLLWTSDTGAYFAGVRFGRTKLFERVSPKKSWEGSIGGALSTISLTFLLAYIFTDLNYVEWFCIAIITIIAGTYGDLVESLLKRSIEIKDSGTTIPGHGGFLDRFDSLLLSTPFVVAFLILF